MAYRTIKRKNTGHASKTLQIKEVNKLLWNHALQYGYHYQDVYSALTDSTGRLSAAYTNDGLHLTGPGYLKWKKTIYNEVYDFPALIPLPANLKWVNQKVSLSDFQLIVTDNPTLHKEVLLLQQLFKEYKVSVGITSKTASYKNNIHLQLTTISGMN